ncbi:MAG: class I SAM-dependent methyltransferase [bacterium]|nr:class I SAM-dependent methyltransferase [bacterium]
MADEFDILLRIFAPLSQYGPGSDASTLRALAAVADLPERPRVLDVGCGPGRQTVALAQQIPASVVGVDLLEHPLRTLAARAQADGLADRVWPVRADMVRLPFPDASFDLVWGEGAIYCMGFLAGLEAWKRLLVPGGTLAVTELSWLGDTRPDGEREFFEKEYPAMLGIADNRALVERAGLELVTDFVLPESDWWDTYYLELEHRLCELEDEDFGDGQFVVDTCKKEIEVLRASQGTYGYVFYIAQKAD